MVKLIAMKGMLISPISNDVSHHNNQFCFIVSPQILLIKKKNWLSSNFAMGL